MGVTTNPVASLPPSWRKLEPFAIGWRDVPRTGPDGKLMVFQSDATGDDLKESSPSAFAVSSPVTVSAASASARRMTTELPWAFWI